MTPSTLRVGYVIIDRFAISDPGAASAATSAVAVAQLREDLVRVLAEERRRGPDRGRRRRQLRTGGRPGGSRPGPGAPRSTVISRATRLGRGERGDDVVDRAGRDVRPAEGRQPVRGRRGSRTATASIGRRSARFVTRSPFVANRAVGGQARAAPIASHSRGHWRSLPTATASSPSAVANVSYGTMFGWALPIRPGARPPTNAFWAWLTSTASVLSSSDTSIRWPRLAGRSPARSPAEQPREDATGAEQPADDVADRDPDLDRLPAVLVGLRR